MLIPWLCQGSRRSVNTGPEPSGDGSPPLEEPDFTLTDNPSGLVTCRKPWDDGPPPQEAPDPILPTIPGNAHITHKTFPVHLVTYDTPRHHTKPAGHDLAYGNLNGLASNHR